MYYVLSRVGRLPHMIKRHRVLFALLIILIFAALILLYEGMISDKACEAATLKARQIVSESVSGAFADYMGENVDLSDALFSSSSVDAEKTLSICAEVLADAEREIANDVAARLKAHSRVRVKIPSGSLSGIKYFSGKGIRLPFDAHLVSSVRSDPISSIESVGINHTLYRAKIKISVDCELILNGKSELFSLEFEKTLAEKIIIGEVPLAK